MSDWKSRATPVSPDWKTRAETAPEEISQLESAIRGAGQGASLGYIDELTGALETGGDVLTGNAAISDLLERYRKHRDESREAYAKAQEANPGTYFAGEFGGGLATALIPVTAAAKVGGVAAGAAQGAKIGALAGLGSSNTDLTTGDTEQAKEAAKDVALGGGIGAVGGTIVPGAKSLIKKASDRNISEAISDVLEAYRRGRKGQDIATVKAHKEASKAILDLSRGLQDAVMELDKKYGTKIGEIYKGNKDLNLKSNIEPKLREQRAALQELLSNQSSPERQAEINKIISEIDNLLEGPLKTTQKTTNIVQSVEETPSSRSQLEDLVKKLSSKNKVLGENASYNIVKDPETGLLHLVETKSEQIGAPERVKTVKISDADGPEQVFEPGDVSEAFKDSARVVKTVEDLPASVKENIKQKVTEEATREGREKITPAMLREFRDLMSQRSEIAKNPTATDTFKKLTNKATGIASEAGQALNEAVPGLAEANAQSSKIQSIRDIVEPVKEIYEKQSLQKNANIANLLANLESKGIKGASTEDLFNTLRTKLGELPPEDTAKLLEILGPKAEEAARVYDLTRKAQAEGIGHGWGAFLGGLKSKAISGANVAGRGMNTAPGKVVSEISGALSEPGITSATRAAIIAPKELRTQSVATGDVSTNEVSSMINRITPDMGKAGETLKAQLYSIQKASPEQRPALLFKLSQDPNYRKLLEDVKK